MCQLDTFFDGKTYTGYKLAAKVGRKYYSIATGIQYKRRKPVTIPDKQYPLLSCVDDELLNPTYSLYQRKMIGRTTVFMSIKDAIKYFEELQNQIIRNTDIGIMKGKFVLLKMQISGELMTGLYNFAWDRHPVVAGKHIDSFKEELRVK